MTLTLDPAIRHTVVHHSSTSTYVPNFIQIEETFCGRSDVRTYGRTDIFPPILLGRLLEVDLKTSTMLQQCNCIVALWTVMVSLWLRTKLGQKNFTDIICVGKEIMDKKTIHMKIAHLLFPHRTPRYYCNGKGLHFGLVNQVLDYFSYSLHLQMNV